MWVTPRTGTWTTTPREQEGISPYAPKPLTSGDKADRRSGKQDFA
jgi:hypothetical protein